MADYEYLCAIIERTFGKRGSLLSLWQELADQFYVERADFTTTRSLGTDFASNLTTSFPCIARRDMGDMFASMLRPSDVYWFKITTNNYDDLDYASKLWLERAAKTQWNAMYDKAAKFQRATKEGDHDYATFGQTVISKEIDLNRASLLYRCWHLRDMAWLEDETGEPCPIFRKWKPTVDHLVASFGIDNVSPDVARKYKEMKTRFDEIDVYHAVVKSDFFGKDKKYRAPYLSIFVEKDSKKLLRKEQSWTKIYTIPRWATVSGSQYAYSPATVAALPDGRLIQQMTLVLLEAGEKAVNPPIVATEDVVRSDIVQFAGGVTWVDAEYDERLGDALRPMSINSSGITYGMQMREDIKRSIESAFYLDKIGLPEMNNRMTAFETAQRVKEYMRKIVPLFSPIEAEYNGSLCEDTFDMLLRNGAFGPIADMPQKLRGQEVKFQFRSPLSENLDRQKAQSFQEARAMLAETIPLDQAAARIIDIRKALRDTLEGIGVPIAWQRSDEEIQAEEQQIAAAQQAQQALALLQQGANASKSMGQAVNQFAQAGM